MGFRGVLLRLLEADADAAFRLVSPDAELSIPPTKKPGDAAAAQPVVEEQKLVVVDVVSTKLLQVTRHAAVMMQPATNSVLWAVAMPFVDVAGGQSATPRRICYCFHFRAPIEFELFAQTTRSYLRLRQLTMLERSVTMEMEIQAQIDERETAKKKQVSQRKSDQTRTKPSQGRASAPGTTSGKTQPMQHRQVHAGVRSAVVRQTAPRVDTAASRDQQRRQPERCVMCSNTQADSAHPLAKHPFVLQDGRGQGVFMCQVCMQKVLKRRVELAGSAAPGATVDNACGLCSQPTVLCSQVKACTHPQCVRVYCTPCLQKLLGKAQTHKVWRTKHWLCPNCTVFEGSDASASSQAQQQQQSLPPAADRSAKNRAAEAGKKKRKRRNQIADEGASPEKTATPEPATSTMGAADYAANYFSFLIGRETSSTPPEEPTEDVCFCCKDGGDLIECDWTGMDNSFAKCPKVYHEYCLGYEVPENITWRCPRHRCVTCGVIALFSCRFCVNSYCDEHLPEDVKQIGNATADIPTSTYILCKTCQDISVDAVEKRKLAPDVYRKIFKAGSGKRKTHR